MTESRTRYWYKHTASYRAGGLLVTCLNLIASLVWAFRHRDDQVDVFLILYQGYFDIFGLYVKKRLLRRRWTVVYEPLISQYDTAIHNKPPSRLSMTHRLNARLIDWASIGLADLVVLDTHANKDYLCKLLGIKPGKVQVCLIAANSEVFDRTLNPQVATSESPLRVLWYGKPSLLHGLPTIVEAFRILEGNDLGIRLTLLAPLVTLARSLSPIQNEFLAVSPRIKLLEWHCGPRGGDVPLAELARIISEHQVVLGTFGSTVKSASVVANKEYEALALGKGLVTREGQKEFLRSGVNCLMVPPEDPGRLADAIAALGRDRSLLAAIGDQGARDYARFCSDEAMLEQWEAVLRSAAGAG